MKSKINIKYAHTNFYKQINFYSDITNMNQTLISMNHSTA